MRNIYALIIMGLTLGVANATTYTYTGGTYASPFGTFTTSMRIAGTFTTAAPLPSNMAITDIGPAGSNLVTSWSFSDGIHSYTDGNSLVFRDIVFQVATSGAGKISNYEIGFQAPLPPNTVAQPMNGMYFQYVSDYEAYDNVPCAHVTATNVCTQFSTTGGDGAVNEIESGRFDAIAAPVVATPVPTLAVGLLVVLAAIVALSGLAAARRRA